MKPYIFVAALAVLGVGQISIAQADESNIYAGIMAGRGNVQDATGVLTTALVNDLGGSASATQDSSVAVGRAFVGYKASENIDLEVGYFGSASETINFSGRSSGGVAYSGSVGATVTGFDYSVLLRPNLASGFNGAYLRLGGHSSKFDASASFSFNGGTANGSASESGSGFLYGIGYDGSITKNLDWRVDFSSYRSLAGDSSVSTNVYSVGILGRF